MLNHVTNQVSDIMLISVVIGITVIGITCWGILHMNSVIFERQIDSTRVQEGLPTDVTLTPEDFRNHPELAEIFEVTNTETNLDLNLESQEHLEMLENQQENYNNIMALFNAIEAFISDFF